PPFNLATRWLEVSPSTSESKGLPPGIDPQYIATMQQLRLFNHPKPLLERFGADFFRKAPRTPGVYIMTNQNGRVLYIGQSSNLRQRLHTYKNANPEHIPRKIVRLVHEVYSLVWEECDNAEAARQREHELLQIHRPAFNTVNTYPKINWF